MQQQEAFAWVCLLIHALTLMSIWLVSVSIEAPGVGVTKAIFSVPLISRFFTIVKTLVTYWISCSYLTGVAAA